MQSTRINIAAYRCQMAWESLAHTDHDGVRFCGECLQPVMAIEDEEGLDQAIAARRCVYLPAGAVSRGPYLGQIPLIDYGITVLNWDDWDA